MLDTVGGSHASAVADCKRRRVHRHLSEMPGQVQAGQLEKALQEAEGAAEQLQDRADAAEDALAEARGDLARQTATNKALLSKLASSRVSVHSPYILQYSFNCHILSYQGNIGATPIPGHC